MPLQLTMDQQRRLLVLARLSIRAALAGDALPQLEPTALNGALVAERAVFVTLWKSGELRGCIGRLCYDRPVWENTQHAAIGAALEDPRFSQLASDELDEIQLEVTLLEPPVDIRHPDEFEAGRHGVIVQASGRMALLLPKVATEHGWGRDAMLQAVCLKAGLAADAWQRPETKLQVFIATEFAD